MGMYTELLLKCRIKHTDVLPDMVISVLHHMFNGTPEPVDLPEHKFFSLPRWSLLGNSNSYYHIPWPSSKYEENYLFSRSDLKNYSSEIEQFLDWISPYIDDADGCCIGWYWYEEENKPTLITMKNGRASLDN